MAAIVRAFGLGDYRTVEPRSAEQRDLNRLMA